MIHVHRDYHMTIFISYLVSTRESRISPRLSYQPEGRRPEGRCESRGLIRDSRVDTWVRYENCHIVIFLSYILIHDHFFPFFVLFIYFILFFILFYFDIPPKRAVERILFPH